MSLPALNEASLQRLLGSSQEIHEAISSFEASALAYSEKFDDLIASYEGKWLALHDREVQAVADTLDALLSMLDERGIPREHCYIRRVERDQQAIIL